ncbi:GNAT family N-acetyltransferase [Paenibacillus xylanexedens]|uniref:GNAT family N-acetyltransferase n=1 Tax=Paenibacillus xylanexedens TaxID=528191 RepID=UPI0011A5B23A|nr:GNAT family N-acetyltransferase [Paenibacillus xylanexedens]
MSSVTLKQLSTQDQAAMLDREFVNHFPWYRSGNYFAKCLEENVQGKRVTLMAFHNEGLAGACHLLHHSEYPFFSHENIPEINDLNVFPEFRRKKIGSALLDEMEKIAARDYTRIGLGVGLYQDYGNAQRMYTQRGYVMDGKGIMYNNVQVVPGQPVMVDDELLLYLVKDLGI